MKILMIAILVAGSSLTAFASVDLSCCEGTSGCIQGTPVTCTKTSGKSQCSVDGDPFETAQVERGDNGLTIRMKDSNKIYSACVRPNND